MGTAYTTEKNTQILIALMKKHGVKKIVVSPGATNICFVASVQYDPFFELYSAVDERSAAYIACGLAEESGEPVALSCTGATASRNYIPGLTEAYYRKLPVLAITSTQLTGRIGHNIPQVIDRSVSMNDIKRLSIELPEVYNAETEWSCCVKVNEALLELHHQGGGPVHINLITTYSGDFSCLELPDVRLINRIESYQEMPAIEGKKIAIFVGSHRKWSENLIYQVDRFCEKYNGVVIVDHTSNYEGEYGVLANLVTNQECYIADCRKMDLLIHIGNMSGAYINIYPKRVWRVCPDGKICDTFKKLEYVFEMEEEVFFEQYNNREARIEQEMSYAEEWRNERKALIKKIPELPFSNLWIAQKLSEHIPDHSVVHFGILNSLRSWNIFDLPKTVRCYSNTGGFGIDGCVSSLLGASLHNRDKLYFGFVGDLAFFYDMNSIGNRALGANLRLLIVNNGKGTEFRNYNHFGSRFGEQADLFIAAAGHYGNKSHMLIKHYAEDLGFLYLTASTKEEFLKSMECFASNNGQEKPIIFEVFTSSEDESEALRLVSRIGEIDKSSVAKKVVKGILGDKGVEIVKKIIR